MAIKARQILDTAFSLGRSAVSAAEKRLRERRSGTQTETSGAPETVGAAKPGKPGGPKSATAATEQVTERPPAGRAKAPAAKPAKRKAAAKKPAKPKRAAKPKSAAKASKTPTPRKRAASRRTTASRAAATSGPEVAEAASGKEEQASGKDE